MYNESVAALHHALRRPTWEELMDKRVQKLMAKSRLCFDTPLALLLALSSLQTIWFPPVVFLVVVCLYLIYSNLQ